MAKKQTSRGRKQDRACGELAATQLIQIGDRTNRSGSPRRALPGFSWVQIDIVVLICRPAALRTKSQPQKEAVGGLSKNQRRPMCFCSRAQPATYLCLPQQLV